jgi:multicomponent K+:H+ antiporter subunit G
MDVESLHWGWQALIAALLAVGGLLLASMVWNSLRGEFLPHELLITLFLFMTAPVSANLMMKAALALEPSARPPVPGREAS